MNTEEKVRELQREIQGVLNYIHEDCYSVEDALRDEIMLKVLKRLKRLESLVEKQRKVVDAAKQMSIRTQTLPWHRRHMDADYCLCEGAWKDWNYGECERLFEAIAALDEVQGE
jgi:hypothetical protein